MATFVLGVPAITFEISSSFSSGVHTLLNTLCFKTSGPFSYMPFESIGIQPLWDVRIRTRMIQFNTHHFKLITITHKNTLLTGCPVKRVHIRMLTLFFIPCVRNKGMRMEFSVFAYSKMKWWYVGTAWN